MKLLSAESVLFIHEQVINPHELQGLAGNKSLDAVMARVENRIQYGMIADSYDLAACYAVVIGTGHVFNDANKRTAFRTMTSCLRTNGLDIEFVAIVYFIGRVLDLDNEETTVYSVSQKYSRKTRRDHRFHARAAQRPHRVFAARATAKVVARDYEIAVAYPFHKTRVKVFEAVFAHFLFLEMHHVASGNNLVCIYIVSLVYVCPSLHCHTPLGSEI